MLNWTEVQKNKELLSKVEKIVDEVADTYYDFPEEVCEELNSLTGNAWTGDNYLEYCAGYWESPFSLEEVVYALFHDGEFPNGVENELHFIRPLDKSVVPTLEVRHKLAVCNVNDSIRDEFEALPMDDIEKWFTEYFIGWQKEVSTKEDKDSFIGDEYGETSLFFEYVGEREYGYEKHIGVHMSNDKIGFIYSKNLLPEEWNEVIDFFKNSGGYTFLED